MGESDDLIQSSKAGLVGESAGSGPRSTSLLVLCSASRPRAFDICCTHTQIGGLYPGTSNPCACDSGILTLSLSSWVGRPAPS